MPSPRLSPKVARLLGVQMFLVIGALVALLAVLIWFTRPNHPGTTGGIDGTNVTITWIAFTAIFAALGGVHAIFGRQLMSEAKGVRRGVASW